MLGKIWKEHCNLVNTSISKTKYNAYDIIPSTIINKYKQCNFWEENVNK